MTITDETRLVDINEVDDILEAVVILAGAALLRGDRLLYNCIFGGQMKYRLETGRNKINTNVNSDSG